MRAIPLRGEGSITLGGRDYVLRYNWSALAELHGKFPKGYNLHSPEVLAEVLAIGLRHAAPDMTAGRLMELSTPLIEAIEAANQAIILAYYGEKGPPEEPAENPPKAPAPNGSLGAATSPSKSE